MREGALLVFDDDNSPSTDRNCRRSVLGLQTSTAGNNVARTRKQTTRIAENYTNFLLTNRFSSRRYPCARVCAFAGTSIQLKASNFLKSFNRIPLFFFFSICENSASFDPDFRLVDWYTLTRNSLIIVVRTVAIILINILSNICA